MLNNGALSITLEDNANQPILEPKLGTTPLWQQTRVTALFEADIDSETTLAKVQRDFNESRYTKTDTETNAAEQTQLASYWHIVEDKDWEREWMDHYHPIQCADNFWICPSWKDAPDPKAVNLKLDPGLAFGTGTHETTFLCLQWLAGQQLQDKYIIDYGCGSGILGIGALLMGAATAIGIDIDPQALLATADNVERNGISRERFPVYFPDKQPKSKADVVFANILAGPLVTLAPKICELLAPKSLLCLSGILASQQESIVEAYTPFINIDQINTKNGWICVTGHSRG